MSLSSTSPPSSPNSTEAPSASVKKKKPDDFIFGKVIGEGSYSTVFLAKEVSSSKEFAIKVLEKRHIIREKKTPYVMREREVFSSLNHPFFVKLYFTFQDSDRLYFGLSYACRGELLSYINKLGCFDENCTRFYTAEIVLALEHLHSLGIIHRDLKPENILLGSDMHIQITDFGSAKILNEKANAQENSQRRNSFVGTAQYVSPEVLTSKDAYCSSDLWALGCIIYQLLSGELPFYGGHEYQIFQKITKLEYEFPEGFNPVAKDLVEKLLVLDPTKRLGCKEMGGYGPLKAHPFFEGVNWQNIDKQKPPELLPYLPPGKDTDQGYWSQYKVGLDDQRISHLITMGMQEEHQNDTVENEVATKNTKENTQAKKEETDITPGKASPTTKRKNSWWISPEEKQKALEIQRRENDYHRFVEGNYIIKQGLVDKRKGLFARRRMLLMTEGPHLYYVDPHYMVLKGQIPWSSEMKPEAKNFKIFFVHTPNRTYYLEDPEGNALKWCKKIEEVWNHYYGDDT